jgi:alkyl hydroperoxide reductase subunit F
MLYDLAIIGGGPAGVAAGVYASRKRLKTVFITESFGGQSIVSDGIENWIGTIKISGADLAKSLEAHLRAYAADIVDIKTFEKAANIQKISDNHFKVITEKGTEFETKTILIASGSSRRKLNAKNADIFEHKGLTYCATCDGPIFEGQDVVVVGGGNAGFESAAQLLAYCKSVTLLHKNSDYKADPITIGKLNQNPKFKAIPNVDILEIKGLPAGQAGDQFVSGLIYKDKLSGAETELAVTGIFVEIGATPAVTYATNLVEMTPYGSVKADPRNQRTSVTGVWAAGDCTDGLYHQNNIAVGDAVKALEDIYVYLHAN